MFNTQPPQKSQVSKLIINNNLMVNRHVTLLWSSKPVFFDIKRLLVLNKLISKLIKRKRKKKTKKNLFKKIDADALTRLSVRRNDYEYVNTKALFFYQRKRNFKYIHLVQFSKHRAIKRRVIVSQLPLLPIFKKTEGSRMGKGKGNIKNWHMLFVPYYPVLGFINWNKFLIYKFIFLASRKFFYRFLVTYSVLPYLYNIFRNFVGFFYFMAWVNRYYFWKLCYLGFFFDDLFSATTWAISYKFLILPGLFLFDKIVSPWMGTHIFKKWVIQISSFFFIENQSQQYIWYVFMLTSWCCAIGILFFFF